MDWSFDKPMTGFSLCTYKGLMHFGHTQWIPGHRGRNIVCARNAYGGISIELNQGKPDLLS